MIELVGRYIDKNRSGYEYSMVWHKLYSEISPTEEVKEGVSVVDEVKPEDGVTVGLDDGSAVGPDDGSAVGPDDGAVEGLEDGVVVRAGLYSQPQFI